MLSRHPSSVWYFTRVFCGAEGSHQATICTQLYKGFPWFTEWFWQIRFDFKTVPNGDSGKSGLTLQLFPVETIVTSNLIGQNNPIIQWKCFIQLGAVGVFFIMLSSLEQSPVFNDKQYWSLLNWRKLRFHCGFVAVPVNWNFVVISPCFAIFKNVVHSLEPGKTPSYSASHQASNYVLSS